MQRTFYVMTFAPRFAATADTDVTEMNVKSQGSGATTWLIRRQAGAGNAAPQYTLNTNIPYTEYIQLDTLSAQNFTGGLEHIAPNPLPIVDEAVRRIYVTLNADVAAVYRASTLRLNIGQSVVDVEVTEYENTRAVFYIERDDVRVNHLRDRLRVGLVYVGMPTETATQPLSYSNIPPPILTLHVNDVHEYDYATVVLPQTAHVEAKTYKRLIYIHDDPANTTGTLLVSRTSTHEQGNISHTTFQIHGGDIFNARINRSKQSVNLHVIEGSAVLTKRAGQTGEFTSMVLDVGPDVMYDRRMVTVEHENIIEI